jgi:hypothetical protein
MHATGITKVTFLENLGSTPATVNKRTGELYLSRHHWRRMNPDQRFFMLMHELGHVALQTSNELEADAYAWEQYAATGRSLKNSVKALTGLLSGNSPEHITRAVLQYQRALDHDRKQNPQKSNPMPTHTNSGSIIPSNGILAAKYSTAQPGLQIAYPEQASELSDFKGRAKRKEQRQEAKAERKMVKAESKAVKRETKAEGKAYKKKAVGDSNVILAQQGINARSDMAKGILGGMAKVAGAVGGSIVGAQAIQALPGLLGANQAPGDMQLGGQGGYAENIANTAANTVGALGAKFMQAAPDESRMFRTNPFGPSGDPQDGNAKEKESEDKNNTMLYVGIGAAVLVVVLLVIMKK